MSLAIRAHSRLARVKVDSASSDFNSILVTFAFLRNALQNREPVFSNEQLKYQDTSGILRMISRIRVCEDGSNHCASSIIMHSLRPICAKTCCSNLRTKLFVSVDRVLPSSFRVSVVSEISRNGSMIAISGNMFFKFSGRDAVASSSITQESEHRSPLSHHGRLIASIGGSLTGLAEVVDGSSIKAGL
eukprot:COSAG02_NODE_1618_length_11639_cov_5.727903_1_plen_188_part_00